MSTVLDVKLRKKAVALIEKYGKAIIYIEKQQIYDPEKRSIGGEVTEHIVKISPPSLYRRNMINGDTILMDDLNCLLAAQDLGFTPKNGDLIQFESKKFVIITISLLYSGEDIAAYEFQLRR